MLEAFGLRGQVQRLPGGQGVAFVVGGAVLKPVADEGEAGFVQALAARIRPSAYRLAAPVSAHGGRWVHEGWVANRWIEDLRPAAPDWSLILRVGEAFAADATASGFTGMDRSALAGRSHRWAAADRAAWDDGVVELDAEVAGIDARLRALAGPPSVDPGGIVHADLAGNVHLGADGTPVVLDLSLYERPAAWGSAVVVIDALLWHGEGDELIAALAGRSGGVGMLARAARFRLEADALAGGCLPAEVLAAHRHVAALLGDH